MIRATILHQRVEVARKVTKAMPGAMSRCDQLIDGDVNRGVSFSMRTEVSPIVDKLAQQVTTVVHVYFARFT